MGGGDDGSASVMTGVLQISREWGELAAIFVQVF